MSSLSRKCLLVSAAFGCASVAPAAFVIDWGGDYVTANQSLGRSTTQSTLDYYGAAGNTRQIAWSETTLLSPVANYTAPSGKTANFYGGAFSSASGTGLGFQTFTSNVTNNATADRLNYRSQLNASTGLTARNGALGIAFLQSDFQNGLNTGGVAIDATSSLTMNITAISSPFSARFMVKQGSQWYVSSTTYTTTGAKTLGGTSLVNETWAAFNPASSLDFNNASSFGGVAWTTITAVGFYAEYALATTSDITARDFSVSGFSADLVAVPEPSAFAAFSGLVAVGFAATRRRRRQN